MSAVIIGLNRLAAQPRGYTIKAQDRALIVAASAALQTFDAEINKAHRIYGDCIGEIVDLKMQIDAVRAALRVVAEVAA
jgi:hypothetical protein